MKVAIIYNGNVRTLEQTIDNNIEKFEFLNPDYFASTYLHKYGYHPAVQTSTGFFTDEELTIEQVYAQYEKLNTKDILIDRIQDMTTFYESEQHKINPNMNHVSSYLQYVKLKTGLKMIKNYDVIIKTRCDLLLNNISHINFDNIDNKLIVDKGNIFPNDCIFMTSTEKMYKLADFMVNEFYNLTDVESSTNPPHGLLCSACRHLNLEIEQHHIIDCVIRANTRIYL
jgi:hypothetical protein